jgi:pimeloyl-ACP methyl ester carboxylesterase
MVAARMGGAVYVSAAMAITPLWNEGRAGLEAAALLGSRIWHEPGVDGGDRPVLLIPGFLAGDGSLGLMTTWLRRAGYRTRAAGLRINVDCSGETLRGLEERLDELVERRGPAVVIGQSRGGSMARALAARRPELAAGLITLGAPSADPLAVNPLTRLSLRAVSWLGAVGVPGTFTRRCVDGECCAGFRAGLAAPWPAEVPYVSIYSRRDGIVDWRACLDPGAENVEVDASHIGMAAHAGTYEAIATALRRIGPADGLARAA